MHLPTSTFIVTQPICFLHNYSKCTDFFLGFTEVNVENGNISIGSTSGTLKAVTKSGNIDVSLSKHDDVTLETKKGKLS